MIRHHRGSGRVVVVPETWEADLAPTAAKSMPDVVSLRVPGGSAPTWNPATNQTEIIPNTPFATNVPARITPLTEVAGPATPVVDEQVQVAGYRVSVPLTATGVDQVVVNGEADTLIDVTASNDPMLVGKTLRVTDVVRGSYRLERDLLATLNT